MGEDNRDDFCERKEKQPKPEFLGKTLCKDLPKTTKLSGGENSARVKESSQDPIASGFVWRVIVAYGGPRK